MIGTSSDAEPELRHPYLAAVRGQQSDPRYSRDGGILMQEVALVSLRLQGVTGALAPASSIV